MTDNNTYYSIDELLEELKQFIADKDSEKFILTKFQANLIYSEIVSLAKEIVLWMKS
jgi:hypothetical protein